MKYNSLHFCIILKTFYCPAIFEVNIAIFKTKTYTSIVLCETEIWLLFNVFIRTNTWSQAFLYCTL